MRRRGTRRKGLARLGLGGLANVAMCRVDKELHQEGIQTALLQRAKEGLQVFGGVVKMMRRESTIPAG
jgi:hypothetical protein